MRQKTQVAVIAGLALCLAGTSATRAAMVQTVTGVYNNAGYGGTNPGFLFTPASAISIYYGNFGSVFVGPATITSFSFDQYDDASRYRPRTLEFIGGTGGPVSYVLADNQTPQTITFATPITAAAGWLAVRVVDTYTGGATDANFGIMSYSFDGSLTGTDVNLNAGLTPTLVGGLGGGYTRPLHLTDSRLHSLDAGAPDYGDNYGSYFMRDAGVDSIRVDYSGSKNIGYIGLGFEAGSVGSKRPTPEYVTLWGSNGNSEVITLAANLQFARYPVSGFNGVTWLRLDFPDGSVGGDWYPRDDNAYGVSEFQAIEFILIPEPGALTLLALGGAGLVLRWRRR